MTRVYTCDRCRWALPVHMPDAETRAERHSDAHIRAEQAEDEAWQWIEQRNQKETGT